MKFLLGLLSSKVFLWAIIASSAFITLQMRRCQLKENEQLSIYNRQLQGKLSDKERDLQSAHEELGVSQAELLTQKELLERLKGDKKVVDKRFNRFRKKHRLRIKSRDKTIARLRQKVKGGSSGTNISANNSTSDVGLCETIKDRCNVGYWWEDSLKRFKLNDPDIFNKDDELFEINQLFKIYGEIWEQKKGSLQVRRLVLREVYLDDEGYKLVPNGKAEIVESKFEYSNNPVVIEDFNWKDMFRLRPIGVGSVMLTPDRGKMSLGFGAQFLQLKDFGLNTSTAINLKNIVKSEQRFGVSYNPKIYNLDLNVAFGLSVGTPFADLFNKYSVNLDLIFYLVSN